MLMTPVEYESVVSDIVAGICIGVPDLAGMKLGFGRANRLSGASGYKHQIDVSLSGPKEIYLIECKRWKSKIGVAEVMILAARGTDIAQSNDGIIVQAVLASTVGATKGAIKLAKYFRIQLEIVQSAQVFGLRIGKHISVGVADSFPIGDHVSVTVTKPSG
jgi:hypothetical protein